MKPIFHLSFPVRDLDEAIAFYVEALAATPGRRAESFAAIFLFGAQITLQNDGRTCSGRCRAAWHFGAPLDWPALGTDRAAIWWHQTLSWKRRAILMSASATEQIKFMIADPSGDLIELKAYSTPRRRAWRIPAKF